MENDDRPPFQIDPNQPWQITLSRGSGLDGLATVRLDHTGRVELHRQWWRKRNGVHESSWEVSDGFLPPEAVAAVLEAANNNRLTELHRAYYAQVWDGTQWVLLIRQGDREKAVYFDDHFPEPIRRFSRRLDEVIGETVGPGLRWRRVPPWSARSHDRELWDAIRR